MTDRSGWLRVVRNGVVAAMLAVAPSGAQTTPQGFDPGSAVGMLTDASANESGAAKPFMGLATQIAVDPLFGTATATIPIDVPPGRKGMTPDLTIRYSSNGGNGPFGPGWDIPLGCVKRNTAHGTPIDYATGTYSDTAGFVVVLGGGTILLDACKDSPSCNSWAANSEDAWLEALFLRDSNSWQLTDRNDVVYTYGGSSSALIGRDVGLPSETFGWYLTDVQDPNGNNIHIRYDADSSGLWSAHAYPVQVDYGGNVNPAAGFTHNFHVAFTYDQVRPDVVTTYRGGFAERVSRRVTAVSVWVGDGSTIPTPPTRQYQFSYQPDPDTSVSLLRSVSETVADGTAIPSTTFEYASHDPNTPRLKPPSDVRFWDPSISYAPPPNPSISDVHAVDTTIQRGFLDVDGDGLPDLVDGDSGAEGFHLYHNQRNAPAWPNTLNFILDAGPNGDGIWPTAALVLSADWARLIDMDGDSLPDVVRLPETCLGGVCCNDSTPGATCAWEFFRNTGTAAVPFAAAQAWTGVPVSSPEVPPGGSLLLQEFPYSVVDLLDLNADGLPDLLDCTGIDINTMPANCLFRQNTGNSFASPVNWYVPDVNDDADTKRNQFVGTVGQNTTKVLIDLNGDGLPDLVSSRAWSQCEGGSWSGYPCQTDACPESRCVFAGGHWDVWFNTGSGFSGRLTSWPAPPFDTNSAPYDIQEGDTVTTRALRDMNGDGLPDYVDATRSPWMVYLNTGAGFTPAGIPWVGSEGLPSISEAHYQLVTYWVHHTPAYVATSDVFDLDGDGSADYVYVSNGFYHARLGARPRANLLVGEDNGLGARCEVSYVPSTDPGSAGRGCKNGANDGAPCLEYSECPGGFCTAPCPNCSHLPFPTWVVRTHTIRTGLSQPGHELPGHDLTTEYTFTGGYMDPIWHQFRGFRQSVETRTADGRMTRRQFAAPPFATSTSPQWPATVPSRPFKLVDERVLDSARVPLTRSQVDWGAAALPDGRVQVHPTLRTDATYGAAGATPQTRRQTFDSYDAYNNLTKATLTGDGIPDPITTTTKYAAAASCHGQPTQITVTTNAGQATSFVLSEQDSTYDTRCNLLTIKGRLAPFGYQATAGRLVTAATLAYDQTSSSPDQAAAIAGLPTTVTDARGNTTTLTYACNSALFPCTIANANAQRTTTSYDLQWGKLHSITDPNHAQTKFTYDGLGRLTEIMRPLDTKPWRKFAYTFGSAGVPTRVDTFVREPNSADDYRTVATFYDSLGRPLETKEEQYVDSAATVVAKAAVGFDSVGRVQTRYAPFAASHGLDAFDPPTGVGTHFAYDALDRVTQTTNPDGTYRSVDYGIAGQTMLFDENFTECENPTGKVASCPGAKTAELRDALGRVMRTDVYAGSTLKTSTTTAYDGLGRVQGTTVTDAGTAKTAPTSFEYDSLSRRTAMTDADSGPAGAPGVWRYAYDDAGNLVYQDDPKTGQHIELCYDRLNRVSRKLYPASDGQPGATTYTARCNPQSTPAMNHIDYFYDEQSAYGCASLALGRLCAVEESLGDASISTRFTYDARGHVLTEYNYRAVAGHSGSYTRTSTYDVADRGTSLTYPRLTDEALRYTYNDAGQLATLHTPSDVYAQLVTYDLLGRVMSWMDPSGLVHTATYDTTGANNFRLQQLKVVWAATVSQQFDYTRYDAAGNLVDVADSTPTYSDASVRNTWHYEYDGLGRLQRATLASASAVPFAYDGLGNMTQGNQSSFAYTGPAPHHLTSVTPGGTAAYESDGGLATIPATGTTVGRTVSYDADGRVQTVTTADGHTVRSVYDYRGERVARSVDAGQASEAVTFYYGRWFEVTGSTVTRHVYLGNLLIAESPTTAPPGLAALTDTERSILVARAMQDAVATNPQLYPVVTLTRTAAATVAVSMLVLCLGLAWMPGRVRVGYLGKVRRGRVALVVVVFVCAGLTPLPWVRPAWGGGGSPSPGGGGGPSPPPPPVPGYAVATDHLGSVTMLICYAQSDCASRSVKRYYRYDPYGTPRAYNPDGTVVGVSVPIGNYIPERLYTGQRWDAQAQLYYYGARFYDPKLANFLSEDPVREYMNPYAYVGWRPTRFSDPTGMIVGGDLGGIGAALNFMMGLHVSGGVQEGPTFEGLTMSASFAALKLARGLGPKGHGPGGHSASLSSLLGGGGLAAFLRFGGLSAEQASVGADFLAEFGLEGVLGTNFGGVLAAVPGGVGLFQQLTAAVREGGTAATAMGLVGLADVMGAGAAFSDIAQIAAVLPAPQFLAGPAIALDVLAFGLTQMNINAALANGSVSGTTFTFLSDLNLTGLAAGVVGNSPLAGNVAVFVGSAFVQLGAFGIINNTIGGGPISGVLLEPR